VCMCLCCGSVRAGARTRAPRRHRSRCRPGPGSHEIPGALARGPSPLPRPQNPTGSAWRLVNVHDDTMVVAATTHRSSGGRQTSGEVVLRPRTKSPNPRAVS
jgi:hypothetical protein